MKMHFKLRERRKPSRITKRTHKMFADAESIGFTHFGWLKASSSFFLDSTTLAGFANEDGGVALVLWGAPGCGPFDPQSVDLISHLDKQRKLKSTTFSLEVGTHKVPFAVPQVHRGIYSYSYPKASLAGLLHRHKQHMVELKAKPERRVKSLANLAKAVRDYMDFEEQPEPTIDDFDKLCGSPQDMKKYEKAIADLEAGRNLRDAIRIVYQTTKEAELSRLVAHHTAEAKENRRKGERLRHPVLGRLVHDGVQFVGKHKTPIYPRGAVEVWLEPKLAQDDSISNLWSHFRRRESELRQELEPRIAKYYKEFRRRADFADMKPLKKAADVWKTLGAPLIAIARGRSKIEISLAWTPEWEEEHGLYVYLTAQAKIRRIGQSE